MRFNTVAGACLADDTINGGFLFFFLWSREKSDLLNKRPQTAVTVKFGMYSNSINLEE